MSGATGKFCPFFQPLVLFLLSALPPLYSSLSLLFPLIWKFKKKNFCSKFVTKFVQNLPKINSFFAFEHVFSSSSLHCSTSPLIHFKEEQTPPGSSRRVLYIVFLKNPVNIKKTPIHPHNSLNLVESHEKLVHFGIYKNIKAIWPKMGPKTDIFPIFNTTTLVWK